MDGRERFYHPGHGARRACEVREQHGKFEGGVQCGRRARRTRRERPDVSDHRRLDHGAGGGQFSFSGAYAGGGSQFERRLWLNDAGAYAGGESE